MRRESVNAIRGLMEDWLPPVLRDSWFFYVVVRAVFGSSIDEFARLRRQAAVWQDADWRDFYAAKKPAQARRGTDNSEATIRRVIREILPGSVLDVGCGSGYLLERVRASRDDVRLLTGVDWVIPEMTRAGDGEWVEASITALPFEDASFDTVLCTHTLEHVPNLPAAVAELRRVAERRLIVVVPRERPYRWTYNAHLHFFAYEHQFSLAMSPKSAFTCERIGRDLYYREDKLSGSPVS